MMRRQHRITRDAEPAARTLASRAAKYLWMAVPWVIVAGFAVLAVKLIVAAP
jgi:hypothetical protein